MIRMTDNGNSIKFTFEDCPQYLYNGVIEVPKNALTMVIDESGMVTFRKSASNDIFLSCLYSELGMSKNEVEAWYKEHGVKDTPSAEEVEDMIKDATQDYFDGAEYDSNSKRINFKHGDTIKGYIDASDFVIDGMVDDVKIENGYLVITFNTESGKQPISIPLTDIFNPNNYYDKTATDALLVTKADTATTYTKSEVDAALSGKQDTLIAGENITISGNVISAEGGGGGNNVVTLTQAEYDSLVDKDPTAFYIISDAEEIDLNNYYTKSETSGATQISTALSGKQDTLIAGSGITISGNVISAEGGGGGGKAIEGGRGISITTGETADTINCTLPMSTDSVKKIVVDSNYSSFVTSDAVITADSLSNSILLGNNTFNIKGIIKGKINNNLIIGTYNTSQLTNGTKPALEGNLVVGSSNHINSSYSLLVGNNSTISSNYQFAVGYKQYPNNEFETSLGKYNASSSGSSTFGDSGNTLFSVGNGTAENARHNAFEIRQNGDIYCSDGTNDVKLQDTITATAANTTALGGLNLVKLTQAQYDALATKDNSTLYIIIN